MSSASALRLSRVGLGPLGRRLLVAFVTVAVSSVAVLTVAALIGVGQGFQVAAQDEREQAASGAAVAAAAAYRQESGWVGADLSAASAVALAAGAKLFVLDASGSPVGAPTADGDASQGVGPGEGQGAGRGAGPVGGQGVVDAFVVVDGAQVGTVRMVFGAATGTRARDVAWWWIGVAALVAVAVALGASWVVTRLLTRPIEALTSAARAYAAGDRQARAGAPGPGELGELAQAFDSMADAVARSERDRRTVTADVAHELRTPLAALQAGLEELRDGLVEPTAHGLAGLHDQSLRLGRVVADLAELAAVESAGVSVHRAEVDLTEIARNELAVHEPQLRAAGLSVHSQLDGPVGVRADSDRIHQAVGNLLANVARYCDAGDAVTLIVRSGRAPDRSVDEAVLEVVDTGPGIAADELEHVFDRLWRGSNAQHVAGTGIGLAISREIVTAHGGTIEAFSAVGSGTTVRISLPIRAAVARST